jgi:hypothetical protein
VITTDLFGHLKNGNVHLAEIYSHTFKTESYSCEYRIQMHKYNKTAEQQIQYVSKDVPALTNAVDIMI